MPPLRPRIGIEQIDAGYGAGREAVEADLERKGRDRRVESLGGMAGIDA
jgi:hypothetical protein